MSLSEFIKYLGLSIIVSLILLSGFHLLFDLWKFVDLAIYSLIFFVVFSVIVYLFGEKISKTTHKTGFLYLVFGSILFKLIGSFVLMFIYVNATNPVNKAFILPFIIVYLVFTVFETYFLNIQAKAS